MPLSKGLHIVIFIHEKITVMRTIFTVCLLLSSLVVFSENTQKALLGNWIEYWYPMGDEMDVYDQRTMNISLDRKGELVITCTDDPGDEYFMENGKSMFVFDNILFQDGILTARCENIEGKSNDGTPFYMYYSLALTDDEKLLKGGMANSDRFTNAIKWTKVE